MIRRSTIQFGCSNICRLLRYNLLIRNPIKLTPNDEDLDLRREGKAHVRLLALERINKIRNCY